MFEAATNREEYYKLLAQKIYHIRKELEDRKNQQRRPCSTKGTGLLLSTAIHATLCICSMCVSLYIMCSTTFCALKLNFCWISLFPSLLLPPLLLPRIQAHQYQAWWMVIQTCSSPTSPTSVGCQTLVPAPQAASPLRLLLLQWQQWVVLLVDNLIHPTSTLLTTLCLVA